MTYQIRNRLIIITPTNRSLPGNKRVKKVVGTVNDDTGQPIPGVNIFLKGTDRGTISNLKGEFTLAVDDYKQELEFSFVGFESRNIKLKGRETIYVVLKETTIGLDEVVAIGYGVAKKSDLTGSISSIKSTQIQEMPFSSIDQGLVGQAAGVNVTQVSGMPGSVAGIRIRGINSLEGGNEPLFVIDGFPIYSGTGYGNTGGNIKLSGLSFFNTSDIESIEILKDASATAIYGARASNGVVLITTMGAKEGPDKVVFDSYYGIQSVVNKIDLMNAYQYAELVNEVQTNEGLQPYYNEAQMNYLRQNPKGTDWQDELFRIAPIQKHQIRFSGGHRKTKYLVSGDYFHQEGIIINSGYKRLSTRMNLDRSIRNNLRLGAFTTISYGRFKNVKTDSNVSSRGVVNSALKMNPVLPVYIDEEQGIYTPANSPGIDYPNPIATANEQELNNQTIRLMANAFGEWEIMDGLKAKFSLGTDLFINKYDAYTPSSIYESQTGSASIRNDMGFNWLNENTVTWEKTYNEQHYLLAMGGVTFQENREEGFLAAAEGFVNDILGADNIGAADTYNQPQSGKTTWSLISYLGRFNYDYRHKYLFSYNMRIDGSSRFGSNNKYALFPSGAFAWRLIEEDFIQDLNIFSNIKTRISYGLTGNQEIGLYNSLPTLTDNNYQFGETIVTGFYPDKIPNPNLKWEKTAQFNVGLDLGFLKNRITLVTDWYHKKTTDLIYSKAIPLASGFATSIDNVGSIQNKGWEFELGANIINGRFRWNSTLNVATNKNKIIELGGEAFADVETSSDLFKIGNVHRLFVGQPIGVFYGYRFDGIFQNEQEVNNGAQGPTNWVGGQRYKDISGPGGVPDGIIDASYDRTIIGDPNPEFHGGFANNFFFEGFECDVFCQFSYGNDILNYNAVELGLPSANNNVYADLVNRWTPENPSNKYPKATKNRTVLFNDSHIEDGSYLKIKRITLAYNFPKLQVKRLDRLRVYITGHNLLTFTNYKGYDPEVNFKGASNLELGQDFGGYPHARTIMLGVKVTLR